MNPADTYHFYPRINIKVYGKTQKQPHRVENQRNLSRVPVETFADVLHYDGDADVGSNRDEDVACVPTLFQRGRDPVA